MEEKFFKLRYFIFFSLFLIIFSNSYFSYSESILYGGSDGRYYYLISKYFPNFGENIEYIKGERFLIPYIVGFISKIINTDAFLVFRILVFISIFIYIFLAKKIFDKLKVNEKLQIVYFILIIFNPYLIRTFIALPTLVLDFIFIISIQIIILGFLEKKYYYIYLGLILSLFCRQNGVLILASLIFCKLIFRDCSIFKLKHILVSTLIIILVGSINQFYASNSTDLIGDGQRLYLLTIFGIFIRTNFDFYDYVKYITFPLLSFGPIILLAFFNLLKQKLKFKLSELNLFLILLSLLIISIAFVGGPGVTGKNLLRLSNYSYFNLILIHYFLFDNNLNKVFKNIHLVLFLFLAFLWSLHPTYSKIKLFNDFKVIFY